MNVTLYHNPKCSKSRQTLALLEGLNAEITLIEYLKTPPSISTLSDIVTKLNAGVRDIIRSGESVYKELHLDRPDIDDGTLLQAIVDNPTLLQRPIAIGEGRAVIGRPPENVKSLFE